MRAIFQPQPESAGVAPPVEPSENSFEHSHGVDAGARDVDGDPRGGWREEGEAGTSNARARVMRSSAVNSRTRLPVTERSAWAIMAWVHSFLLAHRRRLPAPAALIVVPRQRRAHRPRQDRLPRLPRTAPLPRMGARPRPRAGRHLGCHQPRRSGRHPPPRSSVSLAAKLAAKRMDSH